MTADSVGGRVMLSQVFVCPREGEGSGQAVMAKQTSDLTQTLPGRTRSQKIMEKNSIYFIVTNYYFGEFSQYQSKTELLVVSSQSKSL